MEKLLSLIRGLLLNIFSKESLIFIFFLALSGAFWLITVLNDTMERDIEVVVKMTDVPQNVIITSDTVEVIRVSVRDKGYALAEYYYNDMPSVNISFKQYKANGDNVTISSSELQKLIAKTLHSSTHINQVKPERLVYYFNYGSHKTVPVVFDGKLTAVDNYYVEQTTFSPATVTVYGSPEQLKSVNSIKIARTVINDISEPKDVSVSLVSPNGTKCRPGSVIMHIKSDILMDGETEVPVTAINMPAGMQLRTFPARVKVKYVVGSSVEKSIRPEMFVVQADYNTIQADGDKKKCHLVLRTVPESVKRSQLDTEEVDFVIEK